MSEAARLAYLDNLAAALDRAEHQRDAALALLDRMAVLLRDCDRMMTPYTSRYTPTGSAIRALLAAYDASREQDG